MTVLFSFEMIDRNRNFFQIKTYPNQAIKQACVLKTFGTTDKTCCKKVSVMLFFYRMKNRSSDFTFQNKEEILTNL